MIRSRSGSREKSPNNKKEGDLKQDKEDEDEDTDKDERDFSRS